MLIVILDENIVKEEKKEYPSCASLLTEKTRDSIEAILRALKNIRIIKTH